MGQNQSNGVMGSSSGVETFHIEGQEQGLEDEQQQADTKC